jgi:hypothetical protein
MGNEAERCVLLKELLEKKGTPNKSWGSLYIKELNGETH